MSKQESPAVGAMVQFLMGPIVLATYVLGAWGLTASMGITSAFPWSAGPLSNWMVWLALGLLVHLGALGLKRQVGAVTSE